MGIIKQLHLTSVIKQDLNQFLASGNKAVVTNNVAFQVHLVW